MINSVDSQSKQTQSLPHSPSIFTKLNTIMRGAAHLVALGPRHLLVVVVASLLLVARVVLVSLLCCQGILLTVTSTSPFVLFSSTTNTNILHMLLINVYDR